MIVDYYKISIFHPAVAAILMGANWVPSSSLYKRYRTPTSATEAYRNLIFKEWWTNESGVTNTKTGCFQLRLSLENTK